jgi:7-cyano-7-deazaguanine synthase in queuosine biosynthesis
MNGVGNWYSQPSVGIDLDGTLCPDKRSPDRPDPYPHMTRLLHAWRAAGYWVVLHSASPHSQYPNVKQWVDAHGLPIDQIVLGGKPNTDVQIDDRGLLIPPHALEELVALRLTAADPVEQWTAAPPVTQFRRDAENCGENPAYTGDDPTGCAVVIPLTGGLDSATAYAMAREQQMPVRPVYIDTGVEYAADEIEVAGGIAPDLHVIRLPLAFPRRHQHILVGRNAALIWTAAQWAHQQEPGGYSELWMGNHGDETKIAAGDKSIRFHTTMQHLLTAHGLDVHLCHPLQALSKTDLVRWWASRDRLDAALATRTCFTGTGGRGHCGRCWACLQRVLAFGCAGYLAAVTETMPTLDFTGPAAVFWQKEADRRAHGQRTGRDPAAYDVMARLGHPAPGRTGQ